MQGPEKHYTIDKGSRAIAGGGLKRNILAPGREDANRGPTDSGNACT